MASLGLLGVCVYSQSLLAGVALGPFRDRSGLDAFLLHPDVSGLRLRGEAHWAWDRPHFCRHLEVLRRIRSGGVCHGLAHAHRSSICDRLGGVGRLRKDGSYVCCILFTLFACGDSASRRCSTHKRHGSPDSRSTARKNFEAHVLRDSRQWECAGRPCTARRRALMNRLRIIVLGPDCDPERVSIPYVTYCHAAALAKLHDVSLVIGSPVEESVRRAKAPFRT